MFKKIEIKFAVILAILFLAAGYAYERLPNYLNEQQGYASTNDYLQRFTPEKYMRAGTNFFSPRYSPHRLHKPLEQIDIVNDYPFQDLEQVERKLSRVDRRIALKGIFDKITSDSKSDHDRHIAVLDFLYKAAHHNAYVQPMHPFGMEVTDPLVLLELGEMRCGSVARLAADLFDAAGYPTRLVQAAAHQTAEIFYGQDWHLFEADLAGGSPITINGRIPSVEELAYTPFLIDRVPSTFEYFIAPLNPHSPSMPPNQSAIYPSWYFFSKEAVEKVGPVYYYKRIPPAEEGSIRKSYGWDYLIVSTAHWKLTEFEPKYQPAPPEFIDVRMHDNKFLLEWFPAGESDTDLIGYRVYVSTKSRGWNYQDINAPRSVKRYFWGGWRPEMYDNLFKEPPSDIALIETKETKIELPSPGGVTMYVTVMPFDRHGESVGRRLYNMSAELELSRCLEYAAAIRQQLCQVGKTPDHTQQPHLLWVK